VINRVKREVFLKIVGELWRVKGVVGKINLSAMRGIKSTFHRSILDVPKPPPLTNGLLIQVDGTTNIHAGRSCHAGKQARGPALASNGLSATLAFHSFQCSPSHSQIPTDCHLKS
jgi:hypothetical protein